MSLGGSLTVSGKTADGTAFINTGFTGPLGEVVIFRTLYATREKGSLSGEKDDNQIKP